MRAVPELASTPVVLIGECAGVNAPKVTQVNAAAERVGVAAGMSLPQAQARCHELVFRRRNEAQEAVVNAVLLQVAERVSPYLEYTAPGCCTLDLQRHGELDHALWAKDVVAELATLGLEVRVGGASTPDAALQAAHLAEPVLITADPLQAVAGLPVMALNPPDHVLDVLSDWGIERVADLRALDRQQIAERLGIEGLALWDQAGGGKVRPLRFVRAAETYEELTEFEGGIETLEPMLFRLRRSLEQLTRRLRADLLLVGAIELILELDDRTRLARTIHIPAPTCELDTLFRVLSAYLDTVQTEARVNGFRIQAFPSTPRDHQSHLWEASLRDPNGFSETMAKLSGIVGADRVGTPRRLPTHRPNSFRLAESNFEGDTTPASRSHQRIKSVLPAPGVSPIGLCLRRYRPPFRIQVEVDSCRPQWVRGRELEGNIHASTGPWRLDGSWWDNGAAWAWEEWDIQMTQGGLYRLAHHREINWWVLGMYD